ncbi:MAG TPA: class I SAM-dependent methyltransferase [Candidatus Binatia bacterium]|nr:class I SAM-dependent methyltransferase [Candidatus Binatia bacterium]
MAAKFQAIMLIRSFRHLRMIPHPIDAAIRLLDIGAGYGALATAVLLERPNSVVICLDASEAMLKLGRERNTS